MGLHFNLKGIRGRTQTSSFVIPPICYTKNITEAFNEISGDEIEAHALEKPLS